MASVIQTKQNETRLLHLVALCLSATATKTAEVAAVMRGQTANQVTTVTRQIESMALTEH